jgi:uncharacterized membrane protein (DUF106 family)
MKKSFTLFETILSAIILSIVINSIYKLVVDNNSLGKYYTLQKIQNNFIQNNTILEDANIKLKL